MKLAVRFHFYKLDHSLFETFPIYVNINDVSKELSTKTYETISTF